MTPETLPKKKKSPKVFTYLKAVSMTKSLAHLDDIDFDEHYIPWLINRGPVSYTHLTLQTTPYV